MRGRVRDGGERRRSRHVRRATTNAWRIAVRAAPSVASRRRAPAIPLIRNMGNNTRRRGARESPERGLAAQLATGQPGVGAGSPRPATMGRRPVLLGRDLVGDPLPLGGAPPLGGGHEARVLAQHEEGRQPLEAEALDERPVGVAPDEPAVDRVAEDPLGDRLGGGHAHDRAHVAVAEGGEDAVDDRHERRAFGPVGEHDDRDVEDRRPVVERAGHALVARDLEQRIGVLGHGRER